MANSRTHSNRHASIQRGGGAVYEECFYYDIGAFEGGISERGGTMVGTGSQGIRDWASNSTGHFGITEIFVNLTSSGTGSAAMANTTMNSIKLGASIFRFGCIAQMGQSGGSTYRAFHGVSSSWNNSATDHPVYSSKNFVGFCYNYDGTGNAMQFVCGNGTNQITPVNVVNPGDTNWHCYEFEVNADASKVRLWLDGSEVSGSPITTSYIPTGLMGFIPGYIAKISAGTGLYTVLMDAYWYDYTFTTIR